MLDAGHRRRRQPRRGRGRGRHPRPARRRPTGCSSAASSWRWSSRAPRACWSPPPTAGPSSPAPGRGGLRPRRRRRVRRRAGARPAGRLGARPGSREYANAAGAIVASRLACADAMPTVEELDALVSTRGAHRMTATDPMTARPRRPDRRAVARRCSRTRATEPGAVAEAYAARRRPGRILNERGTLFLVAADHPARGALASGGDPMAMADRRSLLARLVDGAGEPRRRRRARHARRRRGAAAARRARGQGRDRLDEPRRPRRRDLDDGRPVHRLRRRQHRRVPASRAARCCSASTTTTPAPPRRSRAARRR